MKLILSRKGFDSQYGGIPSPIFPDGGLLSLPIPAQNERTTFGDLKMDSVHIGELVEQLSKGKLQSTDSVHLDPDLNWYSVKRGEHWCPAFGQVAAAQGHLANNGVGVGDTFLFFGWFRDVELHDKRWRYVPGAPDIHAIFGWLRVDRVIKVDPDVQKTATRYPEVADHPHLFGDGFDHTNTIYVGDNAGAFQKLTKDRVLTAPNVSRSVWRLPSFFYPHSRTPLTYHRNLDRWTTEKDGTTRLRTVGKGQEFVLNLNEYPEAHQWLNDVLLG